MTRPLLIGVTGTIASGKSEFCRLLTKKYEVIDTDKLAKKYLTDAEIMANLRKRWGQRIIFNSELSFSMISEIVFNNPTELQFMNNLIHPKVLIEMQVIMERSKSAVLVFEVPLLFEAGLTACFDFIVLVTADEDSRLNRLVTIKKLDYNTAIARIKAQMDDNLKIRSSDFVINNNSTLLDLKSHVVYFERMIPKIPQRQIISFKQKALNYNIN